MADQTLEAPSAAPWHRSPRAWLETAGVMVVVALLAWLPGGHWPVLDGFAVAVVLVAARFGYVMGVVAGLIAAVTAWLTAGLAPGAVTSLFVARGPLAVSFAYVALGALVGLVGDIPRQTTRRALAKLGDVQSDLDQLTTRYRVLLEAKEAVDRRIVGQVQTVRSLHLAARDLEILEPGKIPRATLNLLARFLEVEAASVYMLDGPRLVLIETYGEHSPRPAVIDPAQHPLGRALSGHERLATEADGSLVMAAPLLNAEGRPRGVIAVERLPFRQLTPATAEMLGLFAEWASRALANSEAYVHAQELQRDHPVTHVHRTSYMEDRVRTEWATARRYGLPLSLILVRDPALAAADEAAWNAGAVAIASVLKARVRNIDVVGHYRTPDAFLMVLPVTPQAGAQILAGRLAEALPHCRVGVSANEQGHADAEEALRAAQGLVFEGAACEV